MIHRNRRMLVVGLLGVAFPVSAWALPSGNPPDSLWLQPIQAGEGWSQQRLRGTMGGESIVPRNLYFLTGQQGIEAAPLPEADRARLLQDLATIGANRPSTNPGGDPPPEVLYIVDKDLSEGLESGVIPPKFLSYLNPGPGEDLGDGCGVWSERTLARIYEHSDARIRTVDRDFQTPILDDDGEEVGYIALDVAATLAPQLVADATGELRYAFFTSTPEFGCLPYVLRVDGFAFAMALSVEQDVYFEGGTEGQVDGNLQVTGSGNSQLSAIKDPLETISIQHGPLLFNVSFWLDTVYSVLWSVSDARAEVSYWDHLSATGDYQYSCNDLGCSGGATLQGSSWFSGFTMGSRFGWSEARADHHTVSLSVGVTGAVFEEAVAEATVTAGFGRTRNRFDWQEQLPCGDADGDGSEESVGGLLASGLVGAATQYETRGQHFSQTSGFLHRTLNPYFQDLHGQGSGNLTPMLDGPGSSVDDDLVTYRVKMRPCFPFKDRNPVTVELSLEGQELVETRTVSVDPASSMFQGPSTFRVSVSEGTQQTVRARTVGHASSPAPISYGGDYSTTKSLDVIDPSVYPNICEGWWKLTQLGIPNPYVRTEWGYIHPSRPCVVHWGPHTPIEDDPTLCGYTLGAPWDGRLTRWWSTLPGAVCPNRATVYGEGGAVDAEFEVRRVTQP